MLPKRDHLVHVGSPDGVQAEAAELRLTEATLEKVITQPLNRLIHLLAKYKRT